MKGKDAEAELTGFIDKFDPANGRLIRATRKALQKRFPAAVELVYDNYNFFVIGYSPNERPSDAIVSIAASANGVSICFIQGARLADPKKLLSGGGKQTRFLRLESAATLDLPGVQALLSAAAAESDVPMPDTGRSTLVIRSVSAKQRPRRKVE
ncbi:MAG: hypothetical protein JWM95_3036 [Gemmatimonadetes bacterium]|nr:hypothetical protein [Gemmatimonadota bacterium]